MSETAVALHNVIGTLDDAQIDALYRVALCFASAQDFDSFTQEQSASIRRSFDEIKRGECMSFASADEMTRYFGISVNSF
jgi:hypothetical protein